MKFAEHLSAHITPEWRKQYIQYELMKDMLYSSLETMPNSDAPDSQSLRDYIHIFDEEFFDFAQKELNKINTFFAEKLAEATRKFGDLINELKKIKPGVIDESKLNKHLIESLAKTTQNVGLTPSMSMRSRSQSFHQLQSPGLSQSQQQQQQQQQSPLHDSHKQTRKAQKKINDLKLAFSEFYLSLVLIQNYQTLNFTGFRKIMKKHDKLLNTSSGNEWRQQNVDDAPFKKCDKVSLLVEDVENVFANGLENGDKSKAMKRLRVPPLGAHQSLWTTYFVGFYSGAFIILISIVFIVILRNRNEINIATMCRLFRGPFFVSLMILLIGVNVYGWRTSGVNHVLIFELDPREHISEQHLFEVGFLFANIWVLSMLGYLFAAPTSLNQNIFPLINVMAYVLLLINPTKTCKHQARFWLLRVLARVVMAPFVRVTFADFWMADQFNSLTTLFSDIVFFVCFYMNFYSSNILDDTEVFCLFKGQTYLIVRAIAMALPAWFRFAQCLRRYRDDTVNRGFLPHVYNAGKYSTIFFVVTFSTLTEMTVAVKSDTTSSPFYKCWIASLIVSTIYTYIWDIKMDWGLMDKHAPSDLKYIREEIVYPSPLYYYLAFVEDFVLRMMWAFTISLNHIGNINPDVLTTISATLEIFRRFIWNFFRLENEHLNNCGDFRAVRDISIAPISINSGMGSNSSGSKTLFKKKKKDNSSKHRRSVHNHPSGSVRASPKIYQDNTKSGEVSLLIDAKSNGKNYDKL